MIFHINSKLDQKKEPINVKHILFLVWSVQIIIWFAGVCHNFLFPKSVTKFTDQSPIIIMNKIVLYQKHTIMCHNFYVIFCVGKVRPNLDYRSI